MFKALSQASQKNQEKYVIASDKKSNNEWATQRSFESPIIRQLKQFTRKGNKKFGNSQEISLGTIQVNQFNAEQSNTTDQIKFTNLKKCSSITTNNKLKQTEFSELARKYLSKESPQRFITHLACQTTQNKNNNFGSWFKDNKNNNAKRSRSTTNNEQFEIKREINIAENDKQEQQQQQSSQEEIQSPKINI